MGSISSITPLDGIERDIRAVGIPYGQCDSTSTATAFTVTVPGIKSLHDGVCALVKNGVVTSAEGCTLNVNGLGAKPLYSSMAAETRVTTVFNVNYTLLVVYDETRVSGGCWVVYYGYYTSTNSIGYQVRTNSTVRNTTDAFRYYKILFSSTDNTKWVPAASSTTNSATSAKTVNQRPINPFGEIVYCSATTSYAANAAVTATGVWQQYTLTLGYSFNRTGAALTLTTKKPVYVKCAPQSDGSAIIDADTPYVQDLPSTADGKIYIWLGIAYSTTQIELTINHPVFYYKDGAIRLWTNAPAVDTSSFITQTDEKVWFRVGNISDTQSESGLIAALLDSSGNATTYNTVIAAYKKTRDIIIYYLAGISNQEIKLATIGRIVDFNEWNKQVTICWNDGANFGYTVFTEGDVGTEHEGVLVQTDARQIYMGDNDLDLTTFLTENTYVRFLEIIEESGETYIYEYLYGGNLDYSALASAFDYALPIVIRYGYNICFISSIDYSNQRITISYLDTANGRKRLHDLVFEDDSTYGVLVKQSETITTIPVTAADVGAVAVAQGVGHAGDFLVVGSDGNVTTVTMTAWQGGSY